MGKLAYRLSDTDPWTCLGFGPLCGPEPTELDVLSRVRLGRLLLDLSNNITWTADDQAHAQQAQAQLTAAGDRCEAGLEGVRRSRRQLHPGEVGRPAHSDPGKHHLTRV